MNGDPRLLRAGAIDIPAFAEGFHYPEDPAFLYRFGLRRNPRTLAGVRPDGWLLLVTVDGRATAAHSPVTSCHPRWYERSDVMFGVNSLTVFRTLMPCWWERRVSWPSAWAQGV